MGNKTSNPNMNLRPEVLGDLTENTNFTESELRHWFKEFRKDFPDGKLTIEQFQEVYAQNFPDGDAAKFAAHVFRTFDHDHDKLLDFREFMCALSITARGTPEERLHWAFRMYDIDESGYISKAECEEVIKAMYKMMQSTGSTTGAEEQAELVFKQMDLNHDSRISLEEFVAAAKTSPTMRLLQSSPLSI